MGTGAGLVGMEVVVGMTVGRADVEISPLPMRELCLKKVGLQDLKLFTQTQIK